MTFLVRSGGIWSYSFWFGVVFACGLIVVYSESRSVGLLRFGFARGVIWFLVLSFRSRDEGIRIILASSFCFPFHFDHSTCM